MNFDSKQMTVLAHLGESKGTIYNLGGGPRGKIENEFFSRDCLWEFVFAREGPLKLFLCWGRAFGFFFVREGTINNLGGRLR